MQLKLTCRHGDKEYFVDMAYQNTRMYICVHLPACSVMISDNEPMRIVCRFIAVYFVCSI